MKLKLKELINDNNSERYYPLTLRRRSRRKSRETYENLRERKIFKRKILEGEGCWELLSALREGYGARERDKGKGGMAETGGQRDRELEGRRRTRIRPLRGRQQAPAGGNGVKCSGNNEVFRCPTRSSPQLARPPAAPVIPLS